MQFPHFPSNWGQQVPPLSMEKSEVFSQFYAEKLPITFTCDLKRLSLNQFYKAIQNIKTSQRQRTRNFEDWEKSKQKYVLFFFWKCAIFPNILPNVDNFPNS